LKADAIIWGIHGGETGEADSLFPNGNCVALGWRAVGDLSKLAPGREAFKTAVQASTRTPSRERSPFTGVSSTDSYTR
jgi:hypothetical protein